MSNNSKRLDELIDTLQRLSLDIKTALDALAIARDEENEGRNPSARPRKPAVGSGNRGALFEKSIAQQRRLSIQQRLGIVSKNRAAVGTDEPNDTKRPFRIGDHMLITVIDPKLKHSRRGTYNPRQSILSNRRRY
jgi:hypothetical protein